jgi:hypothetical protein
VRRAASLFRNHHWIGWSLCALVLACLGMLLFLALPVEPRWVIDDGPCDVFLFGGEILATVPVTNGTRHAPVRLREVATGREVGRFLADGATFDAQGHSRDGRYLVAIVRGDRPNVQRIRWLDVQERREWEVEARLGLIEAAVLSLECDVVAVRKQKGDRPGREYCIAETATGRIVDQFTSFRDLDGLASDVTWEVVPAKGLFVGGGRYFAINYADEEGREHTRLVETRTGKVTDLEHVRALMVSPDTRFLILRRREGTWAWDVRKMDWLCPVPAVRPEVIASPDGERVVVLAQESGAEETAIEFRDAATGAVWWRFAAQAWYDAMFSPDGRYFLLPAKPKTGQLVFRLYDVPGRKLLWERTWAEDFAGPPAFAPDGRTVVVALPDLRQVELLETATGTTRHVLPLPGASNLWASPSRDGRTLLVIHDDFRPPGFWDELLARFVDRPAKLEDSLRAFDLDTAREIGRVPMQGLTDRFWLTEDGRSLVGQRVPFGGEENPSTAVLCWDLPPGRPWRWIVGAPSGLGLVVLAAGVWRQRRRRGRNGGPTERRGDSGLR